VTPSGDWRTIPGPAESASEQVRRYIEDPVAFWISCQAFGPVVRLELGSLGSVVLFSDPDCINEIFRLTPDAFECRPYNDHYRYVMGDLSVLVQDGANHRRQRRMMAPLFRHDRLLPKLSRIRELARGTIQGWPAGQAFNPRPSLHKTVFEAIVELVFGNVTSQASQALIVAHRNSVSAQAGSWGPWRNFARMQPQIRRILMEEVQQRRDNPDTPGFLTHLALSHDEAGVPLSKEECEDHVFTLLVGGVDTTAISIAWALHWLCREPGVLTRLTAELAAAADDPSWKTLLGLPYFEAVYAETLRMYPIVPTPTGRKLTRETTVGGVSYPAGTTLLPCSYLVHRCEDIFPEADRFRPERFLDRQFEPYQYFPFGGGVRTCVGEMLARMEFKTILSTILAYGTLETNTAPPFTPVRHGTFLAPPDESTIVFQPAAVRRQSA
jgi:cytochrome P450 family 110